MAKRKVERRAGPFVVIGGAEDKGEKCEVLSEFVRLAGGKRARLAIISVASDVPKELDGLYERAFRLLGTRRARARHTDARRSAAQDWPTTAAKRSASPGPPSAWPSGETEGGAGSVTRRVNYKRKCE